MAILSADNALKSMLKVYYKDGVENLMFRNSPVLKKIKKERVEGKSYNFSAMYSRGGAVGGDFIKAEDKAKNTARAVEFAVEPGQLFSVYSMNSKEVQAAQSKRGAYMKIAGAKMFAASESFRKTLAAALYGTGYGEICLLPASTVIVAGAGNKITLPEFAVMAIDIDSTLVVKTNLTDDDNAGLATLTVTAVDGDTITVTSDKAVTAAGTEYVVFAGSVDGGKALLPVGLNGWLPTKRANFGTAFYGVIRSAAPERMAGVFYDASVAVDANGNAEKKSVTVQKLLRRCRRLGSNADLIVLNDEDFLEFSQEIESTNTYFTATSTKAKKEAAVGFGSFSAAFSTNFIENIIEDPYCPKGRFYILDTEYISLLSYTNVDKTADGVEGNAAGKPDPMEADGEGKENSPYGLIIDDYLNVQPGKSDINGPAMEVTLQLFGTFAVTNPSVCGVGKFHGASNIA